VYRRTKKTGEEILQSKTGVNAAMKLKNREWTFY